MYIDVHAHILPRVDDGAQSRHEALALLNMLKNQSVTAVAATPHFYASREKTFEEYCARIENAYKSLLEAADDSMPEILLGSEVHFFSGMSSFAEIHKLCIGNSKYILIELPYKTVSDKTADEIIELNLSRGLTPILAHIERYKSFDGYEKVISLIREGFAIGQVNAYSLLRLKSRKTTLKLLKENCATLIAGDCHSVDGNPPRIGEALEFTKRKLGDEFFEKTLCENERIYKEIRGIK